MDMPEPWVHRKKEKFETIEIEGVRIFYRREYGHIAELCLGERYVHSAPGIYFDYETYQGSYINYWHGGIRTDSLLDAAKWVSQAEHPEWTYKLWFKGSPVTSP